MSLALTANRIDISMLVLLSLLVGCVAAFYPDSLLAITLPIFWGSGFFLALYHVGRRSLGEKWLRRIVVAGLLIRVPIALSHLVIGFLVFGGNVDFPGYFDRGVRLAQKLLEGDFEFFELPFASEELGIAIIHRVMAVGYFLVGPNLPGMLLLSGFIGFVGSYLFLRAFQAEFPSSRETRFLAVSIFWFPSLVFWTSLLGKDSWMFFFTGWATYAVGHLLKKIRMRHVFGFIVSLMFVTLIRPPVGVTLLVVFGVCMILSLQSRMPAGGSEAILRPAGYILFSLVIIGGMVGATITPLRQYIGGYSEYIGQDSEGGSLVQGMVGVALYKHVGLSAEGGSSLEAAVSEGTITAVLQYLPGGMFTFLFRPFVFEAHNAVALMAAFDATLLLILVLWRWKHLLVALRSVLSRPFVGFCFGMFLLLTAALSFETNFGAIVRHRTMVIPFLFVLLAVPHTGKESNGVKRHWLGTPGRSDRSASAPAGSSPACADS